VHRPWYKGLPAETRLALRDRYPDYTLEQLAVLAVRDHRELFAPFKPTTYRTYEELHNGFLYEHDEFPHVTVAEADAAEFRDLVAAVLLADRAPSTAPAQPGEAVDPAAESGNLGGRRRKEHPGIALHEAAHLIKRAEGTSDVEIAAAATSKARAHPELTDDVLASHKWAKGMHPKQVPILRKAIRDRLVLVKGGAIRIRSQTTEAWQPLGLNDWAAIPRSK
jgi:hypothetical protein